MTTSQTNPDTAKKRTWIHKTGSFALRFLLPLFFTVALVWYMFEKVSFMRVVEILRHGVDYSWILLAMGISVVSHIVRASRWCLQLRALGAKVPFFAILCSIFGCYALNLVFPRLGELWRCAYISKTSRRPFTSVFGSMMADRLADTATVILILLLTIVLATQAILTFLQKFSVGQEIVALASSWWLWAGIAAICGVIMLIFRFGRGNRLVERVRKFLKELWQGFTVVAAMKGRGLFIPLSLGIWLCYFLQLYVAFFAFPFTRELCASPALGYGLVPCLVAFVLSSIGMAVPSNGGLGPWNVAVMFGLAIYGISDADGVAFSILVWSAQTVMLIILGILTMIYIAVTTRHNASERDVPAIKCELNQ